MSTVPNFLDFTINAVLQPTFIRKLYYKLSSIVTFTFIEIFFIKIVPSLLNGIRVVAFAWYSVKFGVIFGVRSERRKVDKRQIYIETETYRLYSRVFWIFLPNFIKIVPYNFELYHFKVGAFWDTVYSGQLLSMATDAQHLLGWRLYQRCSTRYFVY